MAVARPILALLSILLLGGSSLLIFLLFLGGATNTTPLNQIYFLQADTGNIPGAPSVSRWTFYNLCSVNDKGRNVCGGHTPAFPLDPPSHWNFDTKENIPKDFLGTSKYFYLTRFMFAFGLIGLLFSLLGFFLGVGALISRVGSYMASFFTIISCFFLTISACLMTGAYVKGRDSFNDNGQTAKLGVKAFAFMWTSVALLFLGSVFYCAGGAITPRGERRSSDQETRGLFGKKRSKSETGGSATSYT
ncbi:hypothetical protein FQN54_003533 [Arachnomyces sp. PD_36]|nr:hypothetical protein FQN54_003533 [Arachnomyces sp. PD_36]